MIVAMVMATTIAHAVPAKPVKKVVTLADGTTVELTLRGDEHFSYYTDNNGAPCLLNNDGTLERITKKQVSEKWNTRRTERIQSQSMPMRTNGTTPIKKSATIGKHRGLVILMEFTDEKFVTPNANAFFTSFFNEQGFNYMGMTGSVKDYFLSQSYGQLDIDFDVVGPFTTQNAMAYYGGNNNSGNDQRPAYMALEAVDAAAAVVDYSNYDWDNDGEVDQVFIIYAGYSEAQGASANTIWPHEWTLYSGTRQTRTYNGKLINTYGCAAELMGNGISNKGVVDGIGTACHEYSHCLGLPDMYDTSGDNYAMATWDVMSSGSYNNNSRTPAGYTSYERMYAGWLEPIEINSPTFVDDMKPLATTPEAYIMYNDKNKNEYYMLENRQSIDFDSGLYGHGLLIIHVDYNESAWWSNTVNTNPNHQRMNIIPADNNFAYTTTGMAGDPWPGRTGNKALTNTTTPAAELFNANTDGKRYMNKPIEDIAEDTQSKTISFVACRQELAVPVVDEPTEDLDEAGFTITWPAVEWAAAYEVEVTEKSPTDDDPSESLAYETDFSGCYSSTTSANIASRLADYGLEGWTGGNLYTTPDKLRIGSPTTPGTLNTPKTWEVTPSSEMTVVMGANTVTPGNAVEGNLRLAYGNQGETPDYEIYPFKVSEDGLQVFHFKVEKDMFWISILPNTQMYINYFALYDGTWSAQQLGIGDDNNQAPRRAPRTKVYTTQTNSFTLTGLNLDNNYTYRVRTVGNGKNWYSEWSEQKTFSFSVGTGIFSLPMPVTIVHDTKTRYYDLQGREVGNDARGLLIMKQGNTIKKILR